MKNVKKTILVLAMIFMGFSAQAQFEFGSAFVGGNFSLNASNSTFEALGLEFESNFVGVTASPVFGYFVIDNLAVGISLPMQYSKATTIVPISGDEIEITQGRYGIEPFLRYYLQADPVNVFFQGQVGYSIITNDRSNAMGAGIGMGLNYFLAPGLAIEGLFAFNYLFPFGDEDGNTRTLAFNLGLQYYF